MTTPHLIRGTVPPDSPLRQLAGRTATLPAEDLPQLAERVREMRRANIDPVVLPARRIPWTPIAVTVAAGVLAAAVNALAAILDGRTGAALGAAAAMVLLGIALFPILTHLEMDR
ncbi:hypothetical protein E1193_13535 [Micromonospora sp. KC606]|uniref:hypothetical protein n=1 Tax=Micromonospora sp. KC606 TaxID=2530379 RepID=UPI00104E9120|nr:hypothetical protein [Micromonospora sp. KC606]TDC81919.1 hypothetical protein E1193_13535 [Micromonospora sp. KC606]